MKIKEKDIKIFLERSGWSNAERIPLASDASFRRYIRIKKDNSSAILMLAPPKQEAAIPFVAIGKHLTAQGFSSPAIKAMDIDKGLLLLEDFGDKLLKNLMEESQDREAEYYSLAVELLVKLQQKNTPGTMPYMGNKIYTPPTYDQNLLMSEAGLFTEWYLEKGLGINTSEIDESWHEVWAGTFKKLSQPSVLTLRDYHSENIMILQERKHTKKMGLLDFQDAVVGHRAYDLVSLLQDARRSVSLELEEKMINNFLHSMNQKGIATDRILFMQEYNILGAQRNAKIIGIFTRLWKRDKKKSYTKMIPHVWSLLERNLAHPSLKPVKIWLDEHVDKELRQQPLKDL
jgi:hypothetical protein